MRFFVKNRIKNGRQGFVLLWACTLLQLLGCNYECDTSDTKCENNRIYTCKGSNAERQTNWDEFRNCDDFDAVCRGGIMTKYFDFGMNIESTKHSCVTESYDCQGTVGYSCTEDNKYVVNCAIPNGEMEPVAAIAADNWEDRPFCITNIWGTTFAYSEETCDDYEPNICDDKDRTLTCEDNTWQLAADFCSLDD